MRYLQNSEIDKSKWDACVTASVQQLPYAFSWYLDVVAVHWDAIVLGDYEAVFPLPWKKKWGIRYVYPPFFIQQLGWFSSKDFGEETIQEALKLASQNFKFIELYINGSFSNSRKNYELNLNQPFEEIRAAYSENIKRNIKKAEQKQLQLRSVTDSTSIVQMFRKAKGAQLKTLQQADYRRFELLMNECSKHSMVKFYEVINASGELCAGGCFVNTKGRIVFLFSGNTDAGRTSGAMHFMLDDVIKQNAGKEMIFDFEGSNDENLARFYQSFGAVNVPYSFVKINHLSFPLNVIKK